MTKTTWEKVRAAIAALEDPPNWLEQFAYLEYEEISQSSRFPKLDNAAKGQSAMPVIEEKTVAEDYLFFLREQIGLNARGAEWTDILQRRLDAMIPLVGKTLITAHFYQKPHSATLRVNPETGGLVNAEFF